MPPETVDSIPKTQITKKPEIEPGSQIDQPDRLTRAIRCGSVTKKPDSGEAKRLINMKRMMLAVFCGLFFSFNLSAQKTVTFDIVSFQTPKGRQQEVSPNAVELGVEDGATGAPCLITIFKALPGPAVPTNETSAWRAVSSAASNFRASDRAANFPSRATGRFAFSDIEGKPRTDNASFSAVKGARILWLDDRAFGKAE
jgi:hypothetical protein